MLKFILILFLTFPSLALAQSQRNPCYYDNGYPSYSSGCTPVSNINPLPVASNSYPVSATPITGNAAGTTAAVVGTLAAVAGKTTYICGFNVQVVGGTAAIGPITVAGLVGSSMVYQGSSSAAGGTVAATTFNPCIPASAANTAITITTTAAVGATSVDVNSWGFQQ